MKRSNLLVIPLAISIICALPTTLSWAKDEQDKGTIGGTGRTLHHIDDIPDIPDTPERIELPDLPDVMESHDMGVDLELDLIESASDVEDVEAVPDVAP